MVLDRRRAGQPGHRQLCRRPGRGGGPLPWDDLAGRTWRLDDGLSGHAFEREGDELAANGLYVRLEPWGVNVFVVSDATVPAAPPTHGGGAPTRVPWSSHGDWQPAADRPDPVAALQAGNADRLANLVPIRFGRMAATRSPSIAAPPR